MSPFLFGKIYLVSEIRLKNFSHLMENVIWLVNIRLSQDLLDKISSHLFIK